MTVPVPTGKRATAVAVREGYDAEGRSRGLVPELLGRENAQNSGVNWMWGTRRAWRLASWTDAQVRGGEGT